MIETDQGNFKSSDLQSFWYRRGSFEFVNGEVDGGKVRPLNDLGNRLAGNFMREQMYVKDGLYQFLQDNAVASVNTFNENFTNKLINLSKAAVVGLLIPDSLVTNEQDTLQAFAQKQGTIITKDIEFNMIELSWHNDFLIRISPAIQVLTAQQIADFCKENRDERFAHFAFYQRYIEKKYELRIFYFDGLFYPMAIFSQANEKTKFDFRNYDRQRPNRCVPYKLPETIEQQLDDFMQAVNMNCGSIDMIVTPELEYFFLEVNPLGQFQWLSHHCNYDVERQIAKYLIHGKTRRVQSNSKEMDEK